jgi:hypothetical protein
MECEFSKIITPYGCSSGYKEKFTCDKDAVHIINGKHYCQHHSKLGRFVIREGDVGKIVFRCDTETELRIEFSSDKYNKPQHRMQKVSKSHRRDIY